MSRFKAILLYGLFFMLVSAGFAWYLFPSDALKKYIVETVKQANPNMGLTIERITPAFPPGIRLHVLNFFWQNKPLLDADYLKIVPQWLTLFSQKPAASFNGKTCEGVIVGKADVVKAEMKNPSGPQVTVDADVDGIQIKNIKALISASGYKLTGILNGKITYSGNKADNTVNAKVTLTDCGLELSTPLLSMVNLNNLAFKTVTADITLRGNHNLQIKECKFNGSQLEGLISGAIDVKDPAPKSGLNLSGTLKVHPSLMAKMGNAASIIFKKKPLDSGYPFRISGTIENPDFALK